MAHHYPGHFISEPLHPIPETREIFNDEHHYHSEMEKMRQYLRERESTIQTQMIEVDTLISENNFLKSEVNRVNGESFQFKDTLKRMYLVYLDQQKYLHSIQSANADLSVKMDHQSDKNAHLFVKFDIQYNEIQNMTLDQELHQTRLKEGDKKYHYDVQSLTSQLNDKNIELSELRRKVNDLIEIKRRLEEETAALRFSLDNVRSQMEAQLRERQIRIEQSERSFSENNTLKNEELQHLKNKIKELDMLLLKNNETNRAYLGEIQSLNRELHDKNFEASKIRPNRSGVFFDTGSKENMRGVLNQSDYNQSYGQGQLNLDPNTSQQNGQSQQYNTSGRRGVHFEQSGDPYSNERPRGEYEFEGNYQDQRNQGGVQGNIGGVQGNIGGVQGNIGGNLGNTGRASLGGAAGNAGSQGPQYAGNQGQQYSSNQGHQYSGNQGPQNTGNQGAPNARSGSINRGGDMADRMFRQPENNNQSSVAYGFADTTGGSNNGDQKDKMDKILEIAENATRRRLIGLVLQMWKTKFALSIKNRKGGITLQDQKRQEVTQKAAENLLSNSLANNLVEILSYIRRSSVDILFELYQRSIDASESKKINSLIIFTINLRELKVQFKGVNIILEMYNRLIILIRNYLKDLKSHRPADALVPTITIATGKLWSREQGERDQANKWIESTLNNAIEQKIKTSNEEKNKDIIFLFRLLTLKHKVKYPLQGTPYKVDYDLMSVLEHKICDAFRRAVANEF